LKEKVSGRENRFEEMIVFCGLERHEYGAFFAIKERDGDLMSDRYYWISEPKTP